MKVMIAFQNPKTGEVKHVKCGWSWTLFFWSGFFGLPLFLRKLNVWGIVSLVLMLVDLLIGPFGTNSSGLQTIFYFVFIGLDFWLGLKGNEMTAKNYLEHDWVFVEPDSEITRMAKQQWGISTPTATVSPEAVPSSSLSQPQPIAVKPLRQRAPVIVAIIIVAFSVLCFFILNSTGGGMAGIELDSNGIPKCDSESAKETAKGALENGEYSKLVHVEIISFEQISTVSGFQDGAAHCSASILTNSGRHQMFYTISKMADGTHYYVEAQIQ